MKCPCAAAGLSATDSFKSYSCVFSQGYGFLSENATFVDICNDHNIEFIGPKSDQIRMMGDKSTARDTMKVITLRSPQLLMLLKVLHGEKHRLQLVAGSRRADGARQ